MESVFNKVTLYSKGDLNGFFGLFTNVLLNIIVLTHLSLFVVDLPNDIVFGRILPAMGFALPIGSFIYAFMAYKLAKKEKRNTVTALPYGPSVPHMFIVVFLVMLPAYIKTGDAILAWQTGLAWCLIIGLIVLIGAFVGPFIQKVTPKAAMLGTLAGISITFISMRPAFEMFETPWIAFVSFALILLAWAGNFKMPFNLPSGLIIIIVGAILGWGSLLFGKDVIDPGAVTAAKSDIGFFFPIFSMDAIKSLSIVSPFLATAIPLGIFNFIEAMNNVESAAAAGDKYNLRKVLLTDGSGAIIGACFGSPFPPAVYIGHPGWKNIGGRVGYSMLTGIFTGIVCIFGLVSLFIAIIPLPAILPILLFIGLLIGAQAFQECPMKHAPAIILAFIPSISDWAKNLIDAALNAAGTSATELGYQKLAESNIIYHGLERLGAGSILSGMVLCSIAIFIIDREPVKAFFATLMAAFLSGVGLIHAHKLSLLPNIDITIGYLIMAFTIILFVKQKEKDNI